MLYQRFFLRNAALSVVGAFLGCALPLTATAQDTVTLAKLIESNFPYPNGTLGNDWCYNVETEDYSWWYYNLTSDPKNLQATPIRNIAKIQTTYVPANGFRRYASVFLGLNIPASAGLPLTAFSIKIAPIPKVDKKVEVKPKPPKQTSDPAVLQEPDPNVSTCQPMSEFLNAYVLPLTMTVQDVSGVKTDPGPDYRYWMFNGKGHQVRGIQSYPISLVDSAAGKTYDGIQLVIGYGGGAGP